jgi:hypothetical protein
MFTGRHNGDSKTLCQTGGGSGVGRHHRWEHAKPGLAFFCASFKREPTFLGC